MRGRSVVLGVVSMLALLGCGSSSTKRTVSLSLAGGSSNQNAVACGKQEAFEQYTAPAQVRYTGTVSPAPSGRWKVKVKLKECRGGSFVDTGSQKIVGQPSGRFDGVIPVSERGAYSLRATLEGSGRPQSEKVYLQTG
jgi:hypothetical protein